MLRRPDSSLYCDHNDGFTSLMLYLTIMESTSKAFKRCVDPCPCYLAPGDTQSVPLFEEGEAAVCFPQFRTHRCRGTEENEIVGVAGGSGR